MTYYGRWTYKFEEAARRGAIAAMVIHETAGAGYGIERHRKTNPPLPDWLSPSYEVAWEGLYNWHSPISPGYLMN